MSCPHCRFESTLKRCSINCLIQLALRLRMIRPLNVPELPFDIRRAFLLSLSTRCPGCNGFQEYGKSLRKFCLCATE
jgi:hypothetical protein